MARLSLVHLGTEAVVEDVAVGEETEAPEMIAIIEVGVIEVTAIQMTGRSAVRMTVPMVSEMTEIVVTTRVDVDEADVMIEVPAITTGTVSVGSVRRRMSMAMDFQL
jgi:hypothetical protein